MNSEDDKVTAEDGTITIEEAKGSDDLLAEFSLDSVRVIGGRGGRFKLRITGRRTDVIRFLARDLGE